ncbi:MAG: hypothetical protein K9I94_15400, partial [Bacteroidales bacterium]|nr:hypothetical protein [Bacteroidales bacterium]
RFDLMNERIESMNERFDSVNSRIDTGNESIHSRIDSLFWMMGIIAAFMIFLLGYTIWDRRTALKPVVHKANYVEDKNKSLINALREYARNHPDLAEILKSHGLL